MDRTRRRSRSTRPTSSGPGGAPEWTRRPVSSTYALTADGHLRVHCDARCVELLERWLPLSARWLDAPPPATPPAGPAGIIIRVDAAPAHLPAEPEPRSPRVAGIGSTQLRIAGDTAYVSGRGVRTVAQLADARADVELDTSQDAVDVIPGMNLVAALLLARASRYLVHAAAVMHDDGVWLLAGDAFCGKTTTTLNLARAGWRLLSDDHVVLARVDDAWQVEGWPRMLHVDTGWPDGASSGTRTARDPRSLGLRLAGTGRLRGVLLPRVNANATVTMLSPATGASAMAGILRQSAWSIADPAAASATMAALAGIAALPAFAIELAPDTFRDPARLETKVLTAIGHRPDQTHG